MTIHIQSKSEQHTNSINTLFTMTEQKQQTTKEIILDAAQRVFHRSGLKGARTTEIAKEAGISRTMLHYHFSTKEALYQAVLNKTLGDVVPYMQRLIVSEKDLWKIIKNMIDIVSDLVIENPNLPHFIHAIITESPQTFLNTPVAEGINFPLLFDKPLEKAKKENIVRQEVNSEDLSINILALTVYPYLIFNFLQYKEKRSDEEMKEFIAARRKSIFELIYHGIKSPNAGAAS